MIPRQDLALQDFRKYLRVYNLTGKKTRLDLHKVLTCWFANEIRYEIYMANLLLHEQVGLIEYVESTIRQVRMVNTKETRRKNKIRTKHQLDKQKQGSFEF
jgi:hypothetical protein